MHHAAGSGAGGDAILKREFAVDDDEFHAGAELVRLVVGGVVLDGGRIEHHDVGIGAGLQPAAIGERKIVGRQRAELAHRLLDAQHVIMAHVLLDDIQQARELGEIRKYRAQLKAADLLVIDDLFLRKLSSGAGDELADVLMSRYEKSSTLVTSNRGVEDLAKLLGDVVIVTPLLDRLMHHGHLLKFEGKSWRLKEAAERLAKGAHAE